MEGLFNPSGSVTFEDGGIVILLVIVLTALGRSVKWAWRGRRKP